MPASNRFRVTVSLICLAVGLIGALVAYRLTRGGGGGSPSVEVVAPLLKEDDPEWVWEREWIKNFPQSTLKRFTLTEEQAQLVFPQLNHAWTRFDPVMYFGYRPDLHERVEFDEHADGVYWVTTNSLGLRRDSELSGTKPELRLLVAGDSHADGVCNNAETFSALLEERLDRPDRRVDVLNACRGGQSPFNYLGTLEKFVDLEPDVFLLWFTGSNDFMDPMFLGKAFRGHPRTGLGTQVEARRKQAMDLNMAAFTAGVHSASYFLARPDQVQYSLDLCRDILLEVRLVCEREGIELCVLYMPAPIFMPREEAPADLARMLEILGFSHDQLAQQARTMDAQLWGLCDDLGLRLIDLGPHLSRGNGACFYREDLHLNPAGHRVVRDAVLEELASVLGE